MRFIDDEVQFCLTVSKDISRTDLLRALGKVDELPHPQVFDDFPEETYIPGETGILNVLEDGDFLVTLENNGFLGAALRTAKQLVALTALSPGGHYVCIYKNLDDDAIMYTEVQDGEILARFDPRRDAPPVIVEDFFIGHTRSHVSSMISALEYRMVTVVKSGWLETPTTTYTIDYSNRNY